MASPIATMPAREIYEKLMSTPAFETELLETSRTIELTSSRRGAIIAALWASRKRNALKGLLEAKPAFRDQAALQRAAALLDTPRKLRQAQRQLQAPTNARRRRDLQNKINDLMAEDVPDAFSLTRSFAKILERLLSAIPADRLDFDLIFFENATRSDGPWQPLADVAHLRPKTFQLEHFQHTVFGAEPPADSLVAAAKSLSADTLPAMLERHETLRLCYSYIRTKVEPHKFTPGCRAAIGRFVPLADILWHYEEIAGAASQRGLPRTPTAGRELDALIDARLQSGESLAGGALGTDNFAKLRTHTQRLEPLPAFTASIHSLHSQLNLRLGPPCMQVLTTAP